MLSEKMQRKIFDVYKVNKAAEVKHGAYVYAIAYNACCALHTWIIRRHYTDTQYHWLQPLSENIK